ncbi:MAG: cation:proton antiporter [bacterium]|nr:MAG: cation:proton antiporter [bacterium]
MLASALIFGRIARIFKQPMVFGEFLGGIILGPSVLGILSPNLFHTVFLADTFAKTAREGITQVGMLFFLFIAGLEVKLGYLRKHKLTMILTSGFGILFPFILGVASVLFLPQLFNFPSADDVILYALLIGTFLSISALPIITRILIDLGLIKENTGQIIMASAVFNDVIGWILFTIILSKYVSSGLHPAGLKITSIFFIPVLFLIAFLIRKMRLSPVWKKWNQNEPGQIMMIITVSLLLTAAIVETLGIHSVFGAFLLGVALAEETNKNRVHEIIYQFTVSFFAPLYFVSLGMQTNFFTNFDVLLILFLLGVATLGKVGGASLGARCSGIPLRQSLIIGFGLNARGAIEMILASIAFQYNLINEAVYVALIFVAIITSMISSPVMGFLVKYR